MPTSGVVVKREVDGHREEGVPPIVGFRLVETLVVASCIFARIVVSPFPPNLGERGVDPTVTGLRAAVQKPI